MGERHIVISDLCCRYRGHSSDVLRHVSLEIERGEMIVISGDNGSGKTTLGFCIGGVIPYLIPVGVSGRVQIEGSHGASGESIEMFARYCGYVMQDPDSQFVGLTVEDEVVFDYLKNGASLAEARAHCRPVMSNMELEDLRLCPISRLSLGQKQRVAIATAMLRHSEVLILDQPFNNLDLRGRQQLLGLLHDLKSQCVTIVFLTPNLGDPALDHIADRHFVLLNGSIKEVDSNTNKQGTTMRRRPSEERGPSVLSIQDVTFRYPHGKSPVIDGVTFDVGAGEIIGLVGRNGSGKSTLLRLIGGLLEPLGGHIAISGVDTARLDSRALARLVGFVFQNPDDQLFATTVQAELSFTLENIGLTPTEIRSRLQHARNYLPNIDFGLDPRKLSFGQKKLLCFASTVIAEPKVFILDEPELGLDGHTAAQFESTVIELAAEGRTLIISSHDLELQSRLADRLVLLERGRAALKPWSEALTTVHDELSGDRNGIRGSSATRN